MHWVFLQRGGRNKVFSLMAGEDQCDCRWSTSREPRHTKGSVDGSLQRGPGKGSLNSIGGSLFPSEIHTLTLTCIQMQVGKEMTFGGKNPKWYEEKAQAARWSFQNVFLRHLSLQVALPMLWGRHYYPLQVRHGIESHLIETVKLVSDRGRTWTWPLDPLLKVLLFL